MYIRILRKQLLVSAEPVGVHMHGTETPTIINEDRIQYREGWYNEWQDVPIVYEHENEPVEHPQNPVDDPGLERGAAMFDAKAEAAERTVEETKGNYHEEHKYNRARVLAREYRDYASMLRSLKSKP